MTTVQKISHGSHSHEESHLEMSGFRESLPKDRDGHGLAISRELNLKTRSEGHTLQMTVVVDVNRSGDGR